jgi:hypothetical protein
LAVALQLWACGGIYNIFKKRNDKIMRPVLYSLDGMSQCQQTPKLIYYKI